MNTITPLMHAIMEALDTADDVMTGEQVERAVWASFNGFDDVKAVELALFSLAFEDLVSESVTVRRDVYTKVFALTDAGCDALWALQKAGAISAQFVGVDTASGPDKGIRVTFANGSVIDCVDTNYAPITGSAHAVCFNSRDELRAYTSGAKA